MTALLEVRDLRVGFGDRDVVDGVSFEIGHGECFALVGESGSGKSVTARTLLGLAGPRARVSAAAARFEGEALPLRSESGMRKLRGTRIGLVMQDALVSLDPLRPVGREIADALRLHTRLGPAARRERVIDLLAEAGVPEPERRALQRPGELSGGLRQRALIASAVALRPRLLIADEPTTALDTTVQAGILELFERLRATGTSILLISHDLAVVSSLASRVAVMNDGRIVESGATGDVLGGAEHEYTRRLIAAVPTDRPRGEPLTRSGEYGPTDPAALAAGEPRQAAPGAATPDGTPSGPVLETYGLTRRFGDRIAAQDVSLALARGRTLGLVGESGSGKTTVARLVLALDRPDAGSVRLLGHDWTGMTERERRSLRPRIGAIYQDALSSLDPRLTVGAILADAITAGRSRAASEEVSRLMAQVGLPAELVRRRPRQLSGGERQRLSIARAIAPRPDVLVCDEPVSSLDVSVQAQVLDLLDRLQRELGMSYLFISHDLGVIRHMSDEVAVMRDGRILEHGETEQVFASPQHEYTSALIRAAPRIRVADRD